VSQYASRLRAPICFAKRPPSGAMMAPLVTRLLSNRVKVKNLIMLEEMNDRCSRLAIR
jgi:hypothetical protein